MKTISLILFLMLFASAGHGAEKPEPSAINCQDYSWSDVELLVQPYLDDVLYTALVMQGQSANYKTSEAAMQAMDESLPEDVKGVLRGLIEADC